MDSLVSASSSSARPIDLNAICRLCLSERTDSLKSVFDQILEPSRLPQKIELLMQIQISKYDRLSTMICNDCIIRLDAWYAFKRQCYKNQVKLSEWQNITRNEDSQDQFNDSHIHIKQEPMDSFQPTVTNVKVELNLDVDDELESHNSINYLRSELSDDMQMDDISCIETDDDRRCPDCGSMFSSMANRRRHQNMVHIKKERRAQMMEIQKSLSETVCNDIKVELQDTSSQQDTNDQETVEESSENNNEMNISDDNVFIEDVGERSALKENEEEDKTGTIESPEDPPPSKETTVEDKDKIKFAAGLRLVQKDASHIEFEPLSKIELSYIDKCKAMVSMFHTLQCACHKVQHKSVRYLLSHLRETRIWFPLFTCYNCMISLTDRSTFTKHHLRCPRPQLETLIKLSNLRKRSEVKTRLYQNFKCNRCKFLFSFHEDFCNHIDEDHAHGSPPFYCSCRYVFDSLEEYKSHCYGSCILSYYCDICFVTKSTIEEFVKHSQEMHDPSEGFVLLQDNNYIPRTGQHRHKQEANDESNVVEGKRDRRRSIREPVTFQIYDQEAPAEVKEIPTSMVRKMIQTSNAENDLSATTCPMCKKQYSSINNMMRHYKTHIERKEVILPQLKSENEDLYTCPDCGGVYPASEWQKHVDDHHSVKTCSECDKEFQFQSELDQHRSCHLNLKVYRDSKTQAYKSAMVQSNGDEAVFLCETCDALFHSKDELTAHQSSEDCKPIENSDESVFTLNKEQPYCEYCTKYFASLKSYKDHMMNFHGAEYSKRMEYPKKCKYCDKMCLSASGYKTHVMAHERSLSALGKKIKTEYPKKCEYCDKMFNSAASLYNHTQMHELVTLDELKNQEVKEEDSEKESYHTCKQCFKVFDSKGKLKEHMKSHGFSTKILKKSRKVLCDLCHVSLESIEALEQHKSEEHADEEYEEEGLVYACDICEATFATKVDLRVHKETHSKTKSKNLCQYCNTQFGTFTELVKHMTEEHEEKAKAKIKLKAKATINDDKPHKCPTCGKGFRSHNAMTTHSGWHKRTSHNLLSDNTVAGTSAAKQIKREKVIKKIALTVQKQEPIDVPEYQCSTCFLELPNETALQIHMLEKHGNLDELMLVPRCDICDQDFKNRDEYDTHQRVHDFLERKKMESQSPVIQNVHSVTETRKFSCNWCNSVFSRQDSLNQHIKQHHKEHQKTEFECMECHRVFEKPNSLSIHMKTHQKQKGVQGTSTSTGPVAKVYVCSLCNMSFNFPKDLRSHTISAHPF